MGRAHRLSVEGLETIDSAIDHKTGVVQTARWKKHGPRWQTATFRFKSDTPVFGQLVNDGFGHLGLPKP